MNKIPKSFKIATHTITVNHYDFLDDGATYGMFMDCLDEIRLADNIKIDDKVYAVTSKTQLHSFYHELMHVFNYYFNTDCGEELAQSFSNFIMEFLETFKYE